MKVWIDMTASAHVLVFRPLIEIMRERGDEVQITAREYAQTLQLLELHGLEADAVIGHHGGRSRTGKARAMVSRLRALRRWARTRVRRRARARLARADDDRAAPGHPEHDDVRLRVRVAAAPARLPRGDEGRRPGHDPARAPRTLRRETRKLVQYAGLKEEYYLSDFEPDHAVLDQFALDRSRVLVVLRPPPDVSLYHRHSNPLFPQTLDFVGTRDDVHAIVLPRTEEQRDFVRGLDLPSVIVPEEAVDAQSLIALADLVVSAGGTMNREAAALGVPVYTTYGGRLGGVDEALIRDGRLVPLSDPRALRIEKRNADTQTRVRREPEHMLELLLSAVQH